MNQRKDDHVKHALSHYDAQRVNDFDQVRLIHHSLGAIDIQDTSIATQIGSIKLETPFYINAMTGGTEFTKDINNKLSQVAHRSGLAMAVGSMSAAFKDPTSWDSFTIIRENHKDGIVFANLNPNYSADDARIAVDRMQANAMQIHINTAQEIVMPEGDRSFSHWSKNIREIVAALDVDVIVKEVGFGMSRETVRDLAALGVRIVDVSGRGGTNFAKIENDRRDEHKLDYLNDWGQSTITSLFEASAYRDSLDLIASGGVRHPLDMIKAFVLGAKAVGLSGAMLHSGMNDGVDQTVAMVEQWKEDLHLLMALLGAKRIKDLRQADFILSPELMNYCANRVINPRGI